MFWSLFCSPLQVVNIASVRVRPSSAIHLSFLFSLVFTKRMIFSAPLAWIAGINIAGFRNRTIT